MSAATAKHRVDTHRHMIGAKTRAKLIEKGLLDEHRPLPQTNDEDVFLYREFIDMDYAIPRQRREGVTLSLLSNGGELEWISTSILGVSISEGIRSIHGEYEDVIARYPGEFRPMINAHALKEECRSTVEDLLKQSGSNVIAVASSYGEGTEREFLDSPKAEWLWEFATANGLVVNIHPPMKAYGSEALMQYRLNEAIGRPFDSAVNGSRMIHSGVFDRHPELQVMIVHMGGDLLSILGRLDFNWKLNYKGIENPPPHKVLKNLREPSSYFRTNILVDTMGFNAPVVRAAINTCGVDRVLLGTDYGPVPFGIAEHIDDVLAVAGDAEAAEQILWKNSNRIFKLGLQA